MSADLISWSPFQLLRIEGVQLKPEHNIYFMNVQAWNNGSSLIGLFPATFKSEGGVFITRSGASTTG